VLAKFNSKYGLYIVVYCRLQFFKLLFFKCNDITALTCLGFGLEQYVVGITDSIIVVCRLGDQRKRSIIRKLSQQAFQTEYVHISYLNFCSFRPIGLLT